MKLSESIAPQLTIIDPEKIKPGEIWEISRRVQSPLEFSTEEQQSLYPDAARSFLEGNSSPRYVMIVKEPEQAADPEEDWRIVSVMLLSLKTARLSDADLLIPSQISKLGQDLLAETWHVLPMLTCNLSHPVGRRLSRQIYDILLDVGDGDRGLIDEAPTMQKIQSLGLQSGTVSAKKQQEIQAFHQQEEDWAAVLQVPVAAYRTYLKTMKVTDEILEMALELERESFEELPANTLTNNLFKGIEVIDDRLSRTLRPQDKVLSLYLALRDFKTPPSRSQLEQWYDVGELLELDSYDWGDSVSDKFMTSIKENKDLDRLFMRRLSQIQNYSLKEVLMPTEEELEGELLLSGLEQYGADEDEQNVLFQFLRDRNLVEKAKTSKWLERVEQLLETQR